MASLFKQKRSRYWWIKYQEGGRTVRQSTRLRYAVPSQTRQANEMLSERRRKEKTRLETREQWTTWVRQFIEERYEEAPQSLVRYINRWKCLSAFLAEQKICYPAQLTYEHCLAYLRWRREGNKPLGVYKAAKNTALAEVKFLGLIMKQAIRLGFATSNPCIGLGINKAKPKEKPEITPEHLATIWKALEQEPEWMRLNFIVCFFTACRMCEARLSADQIDIGNRVIHFVGKGNRPFSVPMREELVPWLATLKTGFLFEFPMMPSKKWTLFYRRIGLPQYSTHCLRVTFISIGARAGIPERHMMRLVNHGDPTIHRIYIRLAPQDVRESLSKLPLPAFLPKHPQPGSLDVPQSTA